MFKGSNVALVTPFKKDKLDDETYINLIHFHIKNGTNGLVPAGTTGESPTLSDDEKLELFKNVKDAVGNNARVIAGTTDNNNKKSIPSFKIGTCFQTINISDFIDLLLHFKSNTRS